MIGFIIIIIPVLVLSHLTVVVLKSSTIESVLLVKKCGKSLQVITNRVRPLDLQLIEEKGEGIHKNLNSL